MAISSSTISWEQRVYLAVKSPNQELFQVINSSGGPPFVGVFRVDSYEAAKKAMTELNFSSPDIFQMRSEEVLDYGRTGCAAHAINNLISCDIFRDQQLSRRVFSDHVKIDDYLRTEHRYYTEPIAHDRDFVILRCDRLVASITEACEKRGLQVAFDFAQKLGKTQGQRFTTMLNEGAKTAEHIAQEIISISHTSRETARRIGVLAVKLHDMGICTVEDLQASRWSIDDPRLNKS